MKLALLAAPLVLAACANAPVAPDHAAHHPPAAAAAPAHGQMDSMMKSMQAMHDKMKAAKTAEERAALMKEHMKLMHEGMAMMGRMRGGPAAGKGPMTMDAEAMKRRMDMMEMMMQMMIDREGAPSPAAH
jgi:hypothetical protein